MRAIFSGAAMASALFGQAFSQTSATPYEPPKHEAAPQCFFSSQFQQWKDVDDKTIYIRVNLSDYYRLDMASACPALTYPNPHLVTTIRGPNTICTALDWDLRVADGTGPGSYAVPCIVSKMTKLTTAEAAAIPRKYKPD